MVIRRVNSIDRFKVNAAILAGVQMATRLNNLLSCHNTLVVR